MVYMRRIAALLLRAKDLDDRQGLSRPFTLRESCNACIYVTKKSCVSTPRTDEIYFIVMLYLLLPKRVRFMPCSFLYLV